MPLIAPYSKKILRILSTSSERAPYRNDCDNYPKINCAFVSSILLKLLQRHRPKTFFHLRLYLLVAPSISSAIQIPYHHCSQRKDLKLNTSCQIRSIKYSPYIVKVPAKSLINPLDVQIPKFIEKYMLNLFVSRETEFIKYPYGQS